MNRTAILAELLEITALVVEARQPPSGGLESLCIKRIIATAHPHQRHEPGDRQYGQAEARFA
jgi:hypothetical protein